MTAAACVATLVTCRLNRYEPNDLLDCDYSITQPTQEQTAILPVLGLTSRATIRNSPPVRYVRELRYHRNHDEYGLDEATSESR